MPAVSRGAGKIMSEVSARYYSPNSLANLDRGRVLWADQRKCAKCRRPAKGGSPYCPAHAGHRPLVPGAGRYERSVLLKMERAGQLPGDLLATPTWRNLTGLPTSVRSPLRFRLVMLWPEREYQALAFAKAWREAIAAGKREGDKRRQGAWLANA